jgi:tetratricopeptide (TPR) repeat protein
MDQTEIAEGAIVLAPGAPWSSAFTRPLHASAQGVNPYYRPLQILVATAVHRVAGPAPRAYRAVLYAAAIGTCFAFGVLALRLFTSLPLALGATAFAAAHPAMIESWVWISGLGEALAGFFVVASVACGVAALERGGRAAFLLSIAACALALLAKEKGVVTPVLLAAWWLARSLARGDLATALRDRAALALVGAQTALVVAYLAARPLLMGRGLVAASPIGGDPATHLFSALASWPAQLAWLAFPLHSTTSDGVAIVRNAADLRVIAGLALLAASIALAFWLARRQRPVAAFGLAWIWIAFAPTANLFPQIHAHAERYLFLSVFGLALLATDAASALAARIAPRARVAVAMSFVAIAALFFATRTFARTPAWQSTETLFRTDVARDPGYREGRFHLANALLAEGRFAEAEVELRALREAPAGDRSGYVNAIGVEQIACALDIAQRRYAQAVVRFEQQERAASPVAADPGLRSCVAQALDATGRAQEAAALYERVVASLGGVEPPPALSLSMARTYAKLGRRDEAKRWLARAEAAGPRDPAFDAQLRQVERMLR